MFRLSAIDWVNLMVPVNWIATCLSEAKNFGCSRDADYRSYACLSHRTSSAT